MQEPRGHTAGRGAGRSTLVPTPWPPAARRSIGVRAGVRIGVIPGTLFPRGSCKTRVSRASPKAARRQGQRATGFVAADYWLGFRVRDVRDSPAGVKSSADGDGLSCCWNAQLASHASGRTDAADRRQGALPGLCEHIDEGAAQLFVVPGASGVATAIFASVSALVPRPLSGARRRLTDRCPPRRRRFLARSTGRACELRVWPSSLCRSIWSAHAAGGTAPSPSTLSAGRRGNGSATSAFACSTAPTGGDERAFRRERSGESETSRSRFASANGFGYACPRGWTSALGTSPDELGQRQSPPGSSGMCTPPPATRSSPIRQVPRVLGTTMRRLRRPTYSPAADAQVGLSSLDLAVTAGRDGRPPARCRQVLVPTRAP
jgi:hypothetical protein